MQSRSNYHPRAKRRVSDLAEEYAGIADSAILHNALYDAIIEDDLALRLADTVEELEDLSDRAEAIDSDLDEPILGALYDLTADDEYGLSADVVRERVEAVVAETLTELEENFDEWDDPGTDAAIGEAKQELDSIREEGGCDV